MGLLIGLAPGDKFRVDRSYYTLVERDGQVRGVVRRDSDRARFEITVETVTEVVPGVRIAAAPQGGDKPFRIRVEAPAGVDVRRLPRRWTKR